MRGSKQKAKDKTNTRHTKHTRHTQDTPTHTHQDTNVVQVDCIHTHALLTRAGMCLHTSYTRARL